MINQDGQGVYEVSKFSRVILPIFELSDGPGIASISDQVEDCFSILIEERRLNNYLDPGRFFGVVYNYDHVEAPGVDTYSLQIGLALSAAELRPDFQSGDGDPVEFRELSKEMCASYRIPVWEEPRDPNVYIPSRFERKWVI